MAQAFLKEMSRECTALSFHRLSSLRVLGNEYPKTKCGLVTGEVDQFEFGARLKLFPDFLDLAGLARHPQPHSKILVAPATDEKLGIPNFWAFTSVDQVWIDDSSSFEVRNRPTMVANKVGVA